MTHKHKRWYDYDPLLLEVIDLLKMTSEKFHQTIVMITHNNEIAQLADRIIRIEDGKISE